MIYHVYILEVGERVPAVDVVAHPAPNGKTWDIAMYALRDGRADTAMVRDLVMGAVVSGLAAAMCKLNGFHECCIGGMTPWLRIEVEEGEGKQVEMGI